jgi:hypothetical protein
MPVWLALIVVGVLVFVALVIWTAHLRKIVREEFQVATLRLKTEYEELVHRQTLAEARRLLDANRKQPTQLNNAGPVKIHKTRIRRNHLHG